MTPERAPSLDERASASQLPSLWVLAAFVATLGAGAVLPRLHTSAGLATAATFAGGVAVGLVPLALAARAEPSVRGALALGSSGAAVLIGVAVLDPRSLLAAALVNTALVTCAHAAGGGIGRRVQHPGHLLPACVVAAAADFASVVHPSGPTHAIAESERALSVLAVGFPVPGTAAVAPVLGVGDLLFVALVLGVAERHQLSRGRTLALAALGAVAAGGLSGLLERPIPALVPIGAALCAGLPEARRVRPEDRRTTRFAIALAAAVATGVLLQRIVL